MLGAVELNNLTAVIRIIFMILMEIQLEATNEQSL